MSDRLMTAMCVFSALLSILAFIITLPSETVLERGLNRPGGGFLFVTYECSK